MLFRLRPDPAAAHAAAEAVDLCFRQFGEFQAGYLLQDFSGFIKDAVVTA